MNNFKIRQFRQPNGPLIVYLFNFSFKITSLEFGTNICVYIQNTYRQECVFLVLLVGLVVSDISGLNLLKIYGFMSKEYIARNLRKWIKTLCKFSEVLKVLANSSVNSGIVNFVTNTLCLRFGSYSCVGKFCCYFIISKKIRDVSES